MSSANIVSAICCFLTSLIFWGVSIYAFTRKDPMHFWSGSKVMPEEISDIPAYNRANALMWAIYAACMVLAGILSLFSVITGIILMVITIVPGILVLIVVYKSIYNRYRITSFTSTKIHNTSKGSIKTAINLIATVIIFIGLVVMFYLGEKEPEVIINNDRIQIKGMYGLSIELSEIADISLVEKSMKELGIGRRTNGYGGFGDTLKGNFNSDALGETMLFVHANSSPTIKIERAGKKDIYISYNNAERTNQLYKALMQVYAGKK
ncbi:MAG: hypothetical protein GX757_08115 [Clostridiales bacterium]|nr:hypothetical protein [Clostridiales bacterium]